MAVFKALRSLRRNPNSRSLIRFNGPSTFFPFPHLSPSLLPSHSSCSLVVAPNPFSLVTRLTSSPSSVFSPLRGCIPFSGPLFLSSPAWKLSQSATPLYLRGNEAVFPKDLLRARSFRIGLGFGSAGDLGQVIGWGRGRPRNDNGTAWVVRKEEFLNLPNLISISRMVSGPFIGWMIINEWYVPAFCSLAVSGATDWLDGFVARKMNINSVFGSYLDPLADKVLIGCVALAMVKMDLLHPGLVGLVLLRDVVLVGGAVYKRASNLGWKWKSWSAFVNLDATHREKVEPLFISKVNTVFQLLLVAAALLQPEFGTEETELYITYLSLPISSNALRLSGKERGVLIPELLTRECFMNQVCIWIYLWINDDEVVESIGKIFIAVVSFIAALKVSWLFFMLRRFPILSKGGRKKLNEVGLSAFDKDASLEVLDHPILDRGYYMLTEVLPSALVLYILHKLPPKRVSAQYHPIR
ncbi:hypothetical protein J5N97_016680 [Dioscorea zingiberensis]|uniref:THH1/TOM1/TOM3 domain-containing protein n=1 Tax=Dioscorea zingiberensis TaxID=325984 RepID=A0A9D5HFN0_9LILI|nr:hypothetical protein J5N97_016680 [Dioscorea zingiberensis]